jgi:hypothetical protein
MDELLEKALRAKRESKYIEFKECFDPSSLKDWCEIIKDIVAIANSGGGVIVFGVKNDGNPSCCDISQVIELDNATVTDKIFRYTGVQFADYELLEASKSGNDIAILKIPSVNIPILFTHPGTYPVQAGKQQTAFARGTVYFRHGAKSEPATRDDIRLVIERNLEEIKKSWIKGVRKVVQAPDGYQVHVLPPEIVISDSHSATPIRLVDDPSAPAYHKLSPDLSHPYRQKDVITEVNKKLPPEFQINQFDIRAVRKVYKIDSNDTYTYHPKYSSTQYSQSLVDWLIKQFVEHNEFFHETRLEFNELRQPKI